MLAEAGVEKEGVVELSACERVGVWERCIGEPAFFAIFRTGEGEVSGTSLGVREKGLRGDCLRLVTASE